MITQLSVPSSAFGVTLSPTAETSYVNGLGLSLDAAVVAPNKTIVLLSRQELTRPAVRGGPRQRPPAESAKTVFAGLMD